MKKFTFLIFALAAVLIFSFSAAAADTVYINDEGRGDGLTKDSPMGSLSEAIEAVADGGKIVIAEKYTLTEPFIEPYHNGVIVISGGDLCFNHDSQSRYYLSGPTTFENISFSTGSVNKSASGMFLARFFPIVMGEGINSTAVKTLYVVGGYQFPRIAGDSDSDTNLDSSVTINSGNYSTVVGFSRGSGSTTFRGTANITINGGTIKNVYGASINGSYSGSTNITVNGGTITTVYTGGDSTRRINKDALVTVNGGKVSTLNINNVMGKTEVYYLGGSIGSIAKSIAEGLEDKVTDGSTSLIVRKGLGASEFIDTFDKATYEDGSKVSSAADVGVVEYTVIDKKPAKTTAPAAKVYVSDVGSGDGMTPETATSDLAAAIQMLEGIDGTIVLVNMVEFDARHNYEPDHENHITYTSYDGERYFDGGFNFTDASINRFYFGGNTTIENTKIQFTSAPLFIGRWNHITFGSGLEMVANKIYIVGGFQVPHNDVPLDTNGSVTVESGSYYCVIGYTRGHDADVSREFRGTQTLNILGGEIDRIYGGPAQANTGDGVVINIDGGRVKSFIQTGGDQYFHSKNAVINMKSGHVQKLDMHNVVGNTTLNWTGGTIGEMAVSYGQNKTGTYDVATLAGNASYTLNYSGVAPTPEMLALFNKSGEAEKTVVKLVIDSLTGYVNGVAVPLDAAPVIRQNRTLLPIRFVAENLGATVGWDPALGAAVITGEGVEIKFVLKNGTASSALVNGVDTPFDSPAFVENGRTYMPVRFIADLLGATVDWDAGSRTATLTK